MKTIKFLQLLALTVFISTVTSCVEGDEYDVPPTAVQVEPNVTVNSSIEAVKEAFNQNYENNDESIHTFENDLILEGYVISSDYAGNFYKSLIIQNSPENPTHGIEILVNKTSLFETYEVGRKVYVQLKGLSVTYEDGGQNNPLNNDPGRYRLGYLSGGDVDDIPSFLLTDHIMRSTQSSTIVPSVITVEDFSQNNLNTYVQIQNMQFALNQLESTYSGETSDEFDGFRTLFNCVDENEAILQTSTFADFKSAVIPNGLGNINAVLAKDYRADFFVLIINNPTNIEFTNPNRCDPVILACEGPVSNTTTIFNEDFQSVYNNSDLTGLGWTNVNVSGGSELYESSAFSGNRYMKVSAFGTGESPMETWLVSPQINLDSTTEEELSFEVSANFETGQVLTVFVTENFTGDPKTTDWSQLNVEIPVGGGSWGSFVELKANISCLNGNVNVGFKYKGAAGGAQTRYHIDNVKVTGM